MTDMPVVLLVQGAGTESANGVYLRTGDAEDRPKFRQQTGDWTLQRKSGLWAICSPDMRRFYVSHQQSPGPPTSTWTSNSNATAEVPWKAEEPPPTVSFEYTANSLKRPAYVCAIQERAWKQRKFTDAVVVCNGQRFDVHRATLSAASPVFDAAFSCGMTEGAFATYEIQQSTAAAVEAMLFFMYNGSIAVPPEELPQLLELAVQYELHELCEMVGKNMLSDISVDNVQERAKALKRHQTKVKSSWEAMLDHLREHRELLAALV
eukprot:TRINITY_DN51277_c0_g1_i1.p1 TRINITY_DN51277_c0_g1~~TRINITY_DN51277_c0_g1_i1.p1  ORF type:complete len:264 (-),score=43.61 TRINITY_DN51277_c0_g1_i1:125-916(-)